jgi:hypothetical protein
LSSFTTASALKLLGSTLYLLSGHDNLAKILKYKGNITDAATQLLCPVRVWHHIENGEQLNKNKPVDFLEPHNRVD